MDLIRFEEACKRVREGGRLIKGIGTKGEGSVHAVLKNYFENDQESQELSVGRHIADIVGERGIIEIQTSHFSALREKLAAFLPNTHVTVVYPVFLNKRIVSLSEDGEVLRSRISPLKGTAFEIFRELFPIAHFLKDKNLSFVIMILDCDEYRIPPAAIGKPARRHDRLSVTDRFPTKLIDEISIEVPCDWEKLIPCLRNDGYTTSDLSELIHLPRKYTSVALSVLHRGGIIKRIGKRGRSFTYGFCGEGSADNA
ncbi:MAG: hypothetical protein J6I96_04630 [Oscillospiraceae bacterium]|nr:hypothetical protein [Oscillospiraceae bacterium]